MTIFYSHDCRRSVAPPQKIICDLSLKIGSGDDLMYQYLRLVVTSKCGNFYNSSFRLAKASDGWRVAPNSLYLDNITTHDQNPFFCKSGFWTWMEKPTFNDELGLNLRQPAIYEFARILTKVSKHLLSPGCNTKLENSSGTIHFFNNRNRDPELQSIPSWQNNGNWGIPMKLF